MTISKPFINICKNSYYPQERRFVLEVLRQFIRGERFASDSPNSPDRDSLEWDCVDRFIRQDNLAPLFHMVLEKAAIDPERLHSWQQSWMAYLRLNIGVSQTAATLFDLFRENKIEAVCLRGLHLANFIYPDAGIRPMRDVDVLVRADRETVRTAMRSLGCEPTEVLRTQDVFVLDRTIFEIHYAFLTTRRFRSALESDFLLQAAQLKTTVDGQRHRCLSLDRELISVVSHAYVHHGFDRMMPLVDIALLMRRPEIDWPFIVDWSRRQKLDHMFHFSLAFVNYLFRLEIDAPLKLFDTPLPSWAADAFEAHACRIWGWDSRQALRLRWRTQLYTAQTLSDKWQQWVRFISADHVQDFFRLQWKKQTHQKTGVECIHEFEPADAIGNKSCR